MWLGSDSSTLWPQTLLAVALFALSEKEVHKIKQTRKAATRLCSALEGGKVALLKLADLYRVGSIESIIRRARTSKLDACVYVCELVLSSLERRGEAPHHGGWCCPMGVVTSNQPIVYVNTARLEAF